MPSGVWGEGAWGEGFWSGGPDVASVLGGGGAGRLPPGFDGGPGFAGQSPFEKKLPRGIFKNGYERESWLVKTLSKKPEWRNL